MKNLILLCIFLLSPLFCALAQIPGEQQEIPTNIIPKTFGADIAHLGDINNDGLPDLVTHGYTDVSSNSFSTTIEISDGVLGQYTHDNVTCTATSDGAVASADLDGDGDMDIVNGGATTPSGNRSPIIELEMRHNNDYVRVPLSVGLYDMDIVVLDWNNDGSPNDIAAQGRDNSGNLRLLIYRNNGGLNGSINMQLVVDTSDGLSRGELTAGYLDNDSWIDLFSTGQDNSTRKAKIFFNNQNFGVNVVTTSLTPVDQSSTPIRNGDILITGTLASGNGVADKFENDGDGNFGAPIQNAITPISRSTAKYINPYQDGTEVLFAIGKQNNGSKFGAMYTVTGSGNFNFLANLPTAVDAGDIEELPGGHIVYMGDTANFPSSNPTVVFLENLNGSTTDTDGDGVTDVDEGTDGTDPNDRCDFVLSSQTVEPSTAWKNDDCDNDGLSNEGELNNGTDPLNPDTDGDGVTDGDEAADGTNGTNLCSFVLSSQTLPPSIAWENADCDNDGLNNADELTTGTDPLNPDTDGDGVLDGDDNCPLEGPPGQGQTSNPDGCNTLGVEDNSLNTFVMYPNPADTSVTIELEHQTSDISIVIVNMLGQTVMTSNSLTVDVSQLSLGMYVVQVSTDIGSSAKRLIIQ